MLQSLSMWYNYGRFRFQNATLIRPLLIYQRVGCNNTVPLEDLMPLIY